MAVNTDKNSYTIIFAIIMVVVVGSILALAANGLKPMITENMEAEKQQNILYAMNVNDNEGDGDVTFIPTDRVAGEFSKYITKQYVIEGTKVTENPEAYLIDIKKEATKAKNPEFHDNKLQVFSEKISYKPGETAKVLVRLPFENSTILWTIEKQ